MLINEITYVIRTTQETKYTKAQSKTTMRTLEKEQVEQEEVFNEKRLI